MSSQADARRITAPQIQARKGGEPIVSLTSYHSHTARLLDRHVDVILVGDSLGMVMHGLETTVPVTVEMMIVHGRAVVRGTKRALIVVDLPFGSYEASPVRRPSTPPPGCSRRPVPAPSSWKAAGAWPIRCASWWIGACR